MGKLIYLLLSLTCASAFAASVCEDTLALPAWVLARLPAPLEITPSATRATEQELAENLREMHGVYQDSVEANATLVGESKHVLSQLMLQDMVDLLSMRNVPFRIISSAMDDELPALTVEPIDGTVLGGGAAAINRRYDWTFGFDPHSQMKLRAGGFASHQKQTLFISEESMMVPSLRNPDTLHELVHLRNSRRVGVLYSDEVMPTDIPAKLDSGKSISDDEPEAYFHSLYRQLKLLRDPTARPRILRALDIHIPFILANVSRRQVMAELFLRNGAENKLDFDEYQNRSFVNVETQLASGATATWWIPFTHLSTDTEALSKESVIYIEERRRYSKLQIPILLRLRDRFERLKTEKDPAAFENLRAEAFLEFLGQGSVFSEGRRLSFRPH